MMEGLTWIRYADQKPNPHIAENQGLLIWQWGEFPSTWTWEDDRWFDRYFETDFSYTHWMYIPETPNDR